MEAYSIFSKTFLGFCKAKELGITESFGNTGDEFVDNISRNLIDCKIFKISDKIKKLLCMTKTPNFNDKFHLPFDSMFLDVIFTKEELAKLGIKVKYEKIMGISVCKGNLITKDKKLIAGYGLRITILSKPDERDYIWFDTYTRNINLNEEFKDANFEIKEFEEADKKSKDFVHRFILNFLNFIHDPEVEFVRCESNKERNQKRIKRGKFPIPDLCPISISGKLKIYLDSLSDRTFTYSYRFWVRGHFRTLRDARYGDNVGKRIWVAPFLKGFGVLIEKNYAVGKENI